LGIKHLAQWNKAFLLKLLWVVYRKRHLPWVELIWAKYLYKSKIEFAKPKAHHSPFWKTLLSLKDHALNNLCIKLGNGVKTSFWYDKWLPFRALASQLKYEPPFLCSHFRVSDFLVDQSWDIFALHHWVPPTLITQILHCKPFNDFQQRDSVVWYPGSTKNSPLLVLTTL